MIEGVFSGRLEGVGTVVNGRWIEDGFKINGGDMSSAIARRNKGKSGEREVVNLLKPVVNKVYEERGLEPPVLFRDTNQSAKGGYDIGGIDWLALEVKRQEVLCINKWWEQTVRQAGPGQIPVLFYRQSRKPWRVVTQGYLEARRGAVGLRVELSSGEWLGWLESALNSRLEDFET